MSYPLSSIDILNAVEERISALRWKYERAFTWVARYDRSDLAAALEEGQTVADRICLLVSEGDRFENIHHGRRLHVRRTAQVSLLIADRKSASRAAAVFGSPDNPGAVALKDLVLGLWPRVPSDPIPVPGLLLTTAFIQPTNSVPLPLDEHVSALSGRGAWLVRLEVVGGQLNLDLGQSPIF